MKEIFMFGYANKLYQKYNYKDCVTGQKYPQDRKIVGGKKFFLPWKNTWKGGFQIRDGCTTETTKYVKELKQYAKHRWELTCDEYYDRVLVNFMDNRDLLFFKLRWG
jgi:hypothetical protein